MNSVFVLILQEVDFSLGLCSFVLKDASQIKFVVDGGRSCEIDYPSLFASYTGEHSELRGLMTI